MLDSLKDKNLDVSEVIRDKGLKTGITVALSFPEDYAMVTYPGAMDYLTIDDINFDYIKKARHLHFSNYFLQPGMFDGTSELFERAKKLGLTTSFDPGWDPAENWNTHIFEILKYVDVFLPNKQEALFITGKNDVEEALDILSKIVNTAVIKMGSMGAIAKGVNNRVKSNVFKIKVIDTTGAGDSFNSGYIYNYLKGVPIEDCLVFGSACGAIATTRAGGTTASPELMEVEDFLSQRKGELKKLVSKY
jgi:sugar/nucleoside kinase (ribokinase family)